MKNSKSKKTALLLLLLLFLVNATIVANNADIILQNSQFKLTIGSNAITKSLVLKSSNEELLMQGEDIAFFTATQERPFNNEVKLAHLNKKTVFQADTIYQEGNKLIVGFEIIPYKAVIQVKITDYYINFSLENFIYGPDDYPSYMKITPPPAIEIGLIQLPIKKRKYFGEWLNVVWDDEFAVNVLASDEFARIDSEKRKNFYVLKADAVKDIQLKGTGAALIACEFNQLLNNVSELEKDFNLPRGVESRKSDLINSSYLWTYDLKPSNLDDHIKYSKQAGFRTMLLYFTCFIKDGDLGYIVLGDYDWNKKNYPNEKQSLSEVLNKLKSAGITPGFHFLHTHIGRQSSYVSPSPDGRLNVVRNFTLAKDVSTFDTEIYVEQNPKETTLAQEARVLKVGQELVSYENYTTTPPYKFVGCVRGIDNTKINTQSKGTIISVLDVSEYGGTSIYVDQRTNLQDEIADKLANIYDAGFRFVYFDGSEGVNIPYGFNVPYAQYRVYKKLHPAPIFAEGAAKSHFSWHMLSGGNAFDIFMPEKQKMAVCKHQLEEAPRMKADFTRLNFGWIGYYQPCDTTIGTQPDILEFVTSKAAAWDSPVSLMASVEELKKHPRTDDNLEVLRRWEYVREKKWLTEDQKNMLKNPNQEYILLLNEKNDYELLPYEQITNVANNNKNVRAFIFFRNNSWYVVYWHISGNKKLCLPLDRRNVELYKKLGKKESFSSNKNQITVPVSDRKYLKVNNISKDQLIKAFNNATIIN